MPKKSLAWGAKGHEIVAQIAFHYLDDSTKTKVMHYLRKMSIEEASTWMDENRSNNYYDFMKPWHYIDFDKDSVYRPTAERNVLTVIYTAMNEMKHKETLKDREIKERLLYFFHLVGDLHQPLHCGYSQDKGGNTVIIKAPGYGGNLHSFWDTDMIESHKIKMEDCIKLYDDFKPEEVKSIQKINLLKWMNETRSLLPIAYDFKDSKVSEEYVTSNITIVKRQLLIAGLRLASVLKEVMKTA